MLSSQFSLVHREKASSIPSTMSDITEDMPYEVALARLETLLDAMEEGAVPLAELVEKFGEGNQLLKLCEQRLQEAELKVEKLTARDGEPAFETIDPTVKES